MGTQKTLGWVVAVLGLWEVAAPFVLGYSASTAPLWNAIVVGLVFVGIGAWAALTGEGALARALDWTNVIAGIWLVIAPFLFGYSGVGNAVWNDVVVGLLAMVLAGWAVYNVGRQVPAAHTR
jgi:hypothetical protein